VGERIRAGVAEGDLGARLRAAGLEDVREGAVEAHAAYAGFDDFWEPFTFGVGPAGQHLVALEPEQQERIRDACAAALPATGPFTLTARAWYARGTA
jgi:hypothetical protein